MAGGDGVARLRDKRGDEQVTFGDVADHLADYGRRNPGQAEMIDDLAAFLAEVEDVAHGHDTAALGSNLRGDVPDPS